MDTRHGRELVCASTGDISDSWSAVRDLACAQHDKLLSGAINCFNDMDMLIVGMRGKGNVAVTGCTDDEYRTHFALWSFMASPLIIGCDVRNIDEESLKILKNKDIITNKSGSGRTASAEPRRPRTLCLYRAKRLFALQAFKRRQRGHRHVQYG